jgi:hypothetical protein
MYLELMRAEEEFAAWEEEERPWTPPLTISGYAFYAGPEMTGHVPSIFYRFTPKKVSNDPIEEYLEKKKSVIFNDNSCIY